MKAQMSMTLDTVWASEAVLLVETEFDNPHVLTTGQLARMMVRSLSIMAGELRRENEYQLEHTDEIMARDGETSKDRERERFEDLERDREDPRDRHRLVD